MKANSEKTKQSNKATRRVLAGVLCGASVLSLVLSLVMPPISQAIANDSQAGAAVETVADEATGVGNTAGDTSDEPEGGETGDDATGANQLSDGAEADGAAQPSGDEADDGNDIAPVAEDETKYDIHSGEELHSKLLDKSLRDTEGAATFKLVADIEYDDEVKLEQNNENPIINIVLDLNGHKIKHKSTNQPLFSITGAATLTVKDSESELAKDRLLSTEKLNDQDQNLKAENYGKKAELTYSDDGIPTKLIYYVTESVASGTRTTETLKTYEADIKGEADTKGEADIKGAIVACSGSENLRLITISNGGHFNLESGVITQGKDSKVKNLVYANNSTVNMNGGYVCGGYCPDHAAGAGISVENSTTLDISGGVIAGNSAPSGGGVYANGSTVTVAGGVISGNSTLNNIDGFGGGIMAEGGSVTVSGGFITNNKYSKYCGKDGWGCHGGAGLAAKNGTHVAISGGQITGNYSEEAGGGVYVTDQGRQGSRKDMAWLSITGGTIASNVSFRSEGAGIRVGQMVDAMINGSSKDSPVYITNNHCMSRFDWGGGGVFVQGCLETASNAGRLFVYNSYISTNTAGGYGGGVAVCPTGKTLVTNTDGTAIFGNIDAGDASSYNNENDKYISSNNTGNNSSPHLSGGGTGKTEDMDAYNSFDVNGKHVFRDSGHADFFLAAKNNNTPVAVVTGKMLGDIDAKYSGSIELTNHIAIPANGAAQVKNSIGLSSGVKTTDKATTDAIRNKATTFITGNYSWDHGGGIMSNGNLYLGAPADTYVYPSLKLKATKALKQANQNMKFDEGKFSFSVYRKDSDDAKEPSWNDKTFNSGGCTLVGTAKNDESGNITFDLGEQYVDKAVKANEITYYLVENAGNDPDITYDPAVYKIVVKVQDNKTELMKVPSRENPNSEVPLCVHNYTIKSVSLGDSTNPLEKNEQGYYSIVGPDGGKTFTNKYTPYTSSGSWTPKATKVVVGGEMKEFTLQLAKDSRFREEDIVGTAVTSGDKKKQTLPFIFDKGIAYTLSDITKDPYTAGDSTGRGASKTFTYYMHEKNDSSIFSHYKFDHSVYKFTVTATDDTEGHIDCAVTYRKGHVNSEGNWINDDATDHDLTDTSTPTFTNTYSTSLPLSGMSGVTLTYLAGAAVLCAAAAWIHIRRKANAKGGERRE